MDMTSSLRGQIWCSGGAGFAQKPGGVQRTCFIISYPILCLCVRAWGLGCDWLSARHDVSQLLIREAMKGPPLRKGALCSRLIRKTEILLSLEKKKICTTGTAAQV